MFTMDFHDLKHIKLIIKNERRLFYSTIINVLRSILFKSGTMTRSLMKAMNRLTVLGVCL